MVQPKPVSFTSGTNPTPGKAPEPLIIVGGVPTAAVPAATTAANGTVKKAAAQVDFVAADLPTLITQLNAYLAKERAAGQI